jgi:hypothetical protein
VVLLQLGWFFGEKLTTARQLPSHAIPLRALGGAIRSKVAGSSGSLASAVKKMNGNEPCNVHKC